jgi:amidophosphoribosyltransferase
MCGVVGVIGSPDAAKETFLGLVALQHRGQDAAGILSYDGSFREVKNLGLVDHVFSREAVESLTGDQAIGHTRYSTVGRGDRRDVQPLTLNYPYGVGIVHNGNIVNYHRIKERLAQERKRICLSSSDTEAMLNWLADELRGNSFDGLKVAVRSVFQNVKGSYSVVGLLADGGLFAFRDPNGLRPLVLGKKNGAFMVASESIALQVNGYDLVRDIEPGELFMVSAQTGEAIYAPVAAQSGLAPRALERRPCMFEWVYFASAESEMESAPVYDARLALGRQAAEQICEAVKAGLIKVDVVAPVPDTSRTAASSLAEELGLPYRELLIKNRYIKRTFILGTDAERTRAVDLKLNPVKSQIKGKHILLVDDSIVRGTTSRKIVELVRKAGAASVTFLSTCPPIRYPCFYGIDFPDQAELLAAQKSDGEIPALIGADAVVYLEQSRLVRALEQSSQGRVSRPCMACLDGDYPADVSESHRFTRMRQLERKGGPAS